MKSFKSSDYTWLYFENPDQDDLAAIQKSFNLHPKVLGEINGITYRPRVDNYSSYLFLVLHFPVYDKDDQVSKMGEIDILINDKYLVTSTAVHQNFLYQYFQSLQRDQGGLNNHVPTTSYRLLLHAIEIMLNACFPALDHIADKLDKIEDQVFKGNEKKMVKEISTVKRDLLTFRRTIKPQKSLLESLINKKPFKEDKRLKSKLSDLLGINIRVWHVLESHKETVDSLEATNDSLFSHKLNETMKILATFSVIFLPATLLTSMFGINVPLPVADFWIIAGIMVSLMLGTFLIIKKKWL